MPKLLPESEVTELREKCEDDCDAVGLSYHEHPIWRLCALHEYFRAIAPEAPHQFTL